MGKIKLSAARVNAGLTQKEAAKLLNISNKTLLKWEKGITYPNAMQVDAICDLYGFTYEDIIFFENTSALSGYCE